MSNDLDPARGCLLGFVLGYIIWALFFWVMLVYANDDEPGKWGIPADWRFSCDEGESLTDRGKCGVDESDITVDDTNIIKFIVSDVEPRDPYRNLPCGSGPHTVYNLFLIECDAGQWYNEQLWVGDTEVCRTFQSEEWTDWPRCNGHKIIVLGRIPDDN